MRSIRQLGSLDGRVVLVTGGAGHIGAALSDTFEELGAHVAIADIVPVAATDAERPTRTHFHVDLGVERETRQLVDDVVDRCGGLDVLVHCAGYVGTTQLAGWNVPLDRQTVCAWDAAIRVNVTAAFVLAQAARGFLERSGRGAIVFVSSIYGQVAPDPRIYCGTELTTPAAYSASKAALAQLARHLAAAYAPRVRVNTLTPGGLARAQPAAFVERYAARTPLQRMGTEEDLKGAAAFLASDLSAYVTGHDLVVDGGWTVW